MALAGAAVLALSACSSANNGTGSANQTSPSGSGSTSSSSSAPSSSSSAPVANKPVHVSLQMSDGTQVGVGMPIIAYLSRSITDAKAFNAATKVNVNGQPATGSWFFEYKSGLPGKPIEADWRMEN